MGHFIEFFIRSARCDREFFVSFFSPVDIDRIRRWLEIKNSDNTMDVLEKDSSHLTMTVGGSYTTPKILSTLIVAYLISYRAV